jgi:hypothetical protein
MKDEERLRVGVLKAMCTSEPMQDAVNEHKYTYAVLRCQAARRFFSGGFVDSWRRVSGACQAPACAPEFPSRGREFQASRLCRGGGFIALEYAARYGLLR